jgi:hypothetical protein
MLNLWDSGNNVFSDNDEPPSKRPVPTTSSSTSLDLPVSNFKQIPVDVLAEIVSYLYYPHEFIKTKNLKDKKPKKIENPHWIKDINIKELVMLKSVNTLFNKTVHEYLCIAFKERSFVPFEIIQNSPNRSSQIKHFIKALRDAQSRISITMEAKMKKSSEERSEPYLYVTLNFSNKNIGVEISNAGTKETPQSSYMSLQEMFLRTAGIPFPSAPDTPPNYRDAEIKESGPLEELDLSTNNIDTYGIKIVIEAIKLSNTLKKLTLCLNKIGSEGAKLLAEALKEKSMILEELDICGHNIGNIGALHIAKALRVNTSIERLNLSNNHISDDGAEILKETFMENNAWIKILDLSHNWKISDSKNRFFKKHKGKGPLKQPEEI